MVTIKQIASKVGVSSATVSRVLNFDATLSITEAKRQAIIETAEALNYETPRARNRASKRKLKKIALVHFLRPEQELTDPYYVAMRLGIERLCQKLKVEVAKVFHSQDMTEAQVLRDADGVIVIGRQPDTALDWISTYCRHIVCADFAPKNDEIDSVVTDLPNATKRLLNALEAIGYQKIAFIGWDPKWEEGDPQGTEPRKQAFIDWMNARSQFDADYCLAQNNSEESGYKLTQQLLELPQRPDVIICCNDNLAVGAYRAIQERHLSIPAEIAIASFNDISVAQFLHPPLSTVRLPAEETGETAVELLLERIEGRKLAKRIMLSTEMKWRASTADWQGASKEVGSL